MSDARKYVGYIQNGGVSTFPFISGSEGSYAWYGAGQGYTEVTLTNDAEIQSIQFLASSGFGYGIGNLDYELLEKGSLVATGTVPIRNSGLDRTMTWYGFSGGGFDEVRLQVLYFSTQFHSDLTIYNSLGEPSDLDAGAFDSFGAIAQTPIPATLPLFASGLGGLALLSWRRKWKNTIMPVSLMT